MQTFVPVLAVNISLYGLEVMLLGTRHGPIILSRREVSARQSVSTKMNRPGFLEGSNP